MDCRFYWGNGGFGTIIDKVKLSLTLEMAFSCFSDGLSNLYVSCAILNRDNLYFFN